MIPSKNKTLLLFWLLLSGAALTVNAQVKIGNNPNTINSNSLLEMESTNKGFLPPRIALNNANSVSPLTGTVTPGMLVYSSGGTLTDGYYYWNATKWLRVASSANARNNYVLVKTAADFPAPVAGVITLDPATLYEINGMITLTDKIDLNSAYLTGGDRFDDQLIYTGSAEMFTGSAGGTISTLMLTVSGAGSKLFNLNAGVGMPGLFTFENSLIMGCASLGLIKGMFVANFQSLIFGGNANGLTLQDVGDFTGNNLLWLSDNSNTCLTFSGTFNTILIVGGNFNPQAAFSATAINVTGITAITGGAQIKSVLFVGNGTYVNGTFSNKWEVEATGLSTEKDDVATGNLYLNSQALTVIGSANTPVKVLGTTTAVGLFRVTSPVSNRIVYTGAKTRRFSAICSLSLSAMSSNRTFSFYIAKNGVIQTQSKQTLKLGTSSDKGSVTLSCTVQLAPNDYIEVWVENNLDSSDLTIETLNLLLN